MKKIGKGSNGSELFTVIEPGMPSNQLSEMEKDLILGGECGADTCVGFMCGGYNCGALSPCYSETCVEYECIIEICPAELPCIIDVLCMFNDPYNGSESDSESDSESYSDEFRYSIMA